MEILYIYLDKFKNLDKKSFCFTSEFIFETIVKKRSIDIVIRKNPTYIANFFENDSILNVTAIVGQNGTGKSNILEFIRSSLPDGVGGSSQEFIIAVKDRNSYMPSFLTYHTPGLKVEVTDVSKLFSVITLPENKKDKFIQTLYQVNSFNSTIFVNYSNIVDLKIPSSITITKLESEEESLSALGYYNISTMAMLSTDFHSYPNDSSLAIEKLDAYKSREFGRNVEFITSPYRNILDFSLPEYLHVTLMSEDERFLRQHPSEFAWVFDATSKFDQEFSSISGSKKPIFHLRFLRSIFFNLVRAEQSSYLKNMVREITLNTAGKTFEAFVRNILNKMQDIGASNENEMVLLKKGETILKLVDFIYEFLIKNDHDDKIVIVDESIIALPVQFEGLFSIQVFIDLYIKAKIGTDFLIFKWRSLSSGEQSMLTLVSRLYYLSKEIGRDKESMIILLDEPDIYFHPEWQRKLLDQLFNYIPTIFQNRTIQIIITANTPYVVSDLPGSNVILLKKKDGKVLVENASQSNKLTFASNIHTLLSEDFYVSNFIGEFAKNKIESLIKFLKSPRATESFDKETAQVFINYIGEPIIRNRLQDMYDEKFRESKESLAMRYERLKVELKELEQNILNNNA